MSDMTTDNLHSLGNEIREIEHRFKQEIEPFRSELWGYCYKLTRSPWDAEDLVQDTLLKSLGMLAKMHQPVHTKAYIFRIATNLWIDKKRRDRNQEQPLIEELHHDNGTAFNFQLIDNLDYLIDHLTPVQYVTLILTEAFQFKAKEAAGIMGTSENAIYANLSRARAVLKKIGDIPASGEVRTADLSPDGPLAVLLEGFRSKDPECIASILSKDVIVDITHAGVEMGLDETKKNSLKDWKQIVDEQHEIVAEYRELWGLPVVAEFEKKADGKLYLSNIHYVEAYEDEITYWKFYCFSWDLMKLAADELGVGLNAAYFYHIY
ncbi:RNA polymerase sigma factor [Bacillus sp. V3]|nr:RNA polymerase sigma factor [Bacillus sp. V3]